MRELIVPRKKKKLLAKLLKYRPAQQVVSLACVRAKRESWSQALLAEIMETEDGNCYLSQRHALFCEESLGKIDAEMSSFPGTGRSTNSIAWKR